MDELDRKILTGNLQSLEMKVKGDEGYETQQELFQFDIIHGQSIG
jgi:hypothetical protein